MYPVNPNQSLTIDAERSSVCYIYSFAETPATVPLNGGVIQPGETIALKATIGEPNTIRVEETSTGVFGRRLLILEPLEKHTPAAPAPTVLKSLGKQSNAVIPYTLASFNDPIRQSRTDCVQEAWGRYPWGGEWRICTGHRTQLRCIHHDLVLVITGPNESSIRAAIEDCMKKATVVSALSALVSAFYSGDLTGHDAVRIYKYALGLSERHENPDSQHQR